MCVQIMLRCLLSKQKSLVLLSKVKGGTYDNSEQQHNNIINNKNSIL